MKMWNVGRKDQAASNRMEGFIKKLVRKFLDCSGKRSHLEDRDKFFETINRSIPIVHRDDQLWKVDHLFSYLLSEQGVSWLEAKKEMKDGRIAVRTSNVHGKVFYRINNGQIQVYTIYEWMNDENEDYSGTDFKWIVTDVRELRNGIIVR